MGSWLSHGCPTLLHFSPLRNPCAPLASPSGTRTSPGRPPFDPRGLRLGERDALRVDAGAGERAGAAASREVERLETLEPRAERKGEPRGEAVARAVRICGIGRKRRRASTGRPAAPILRAHRTSSRRGGARGRAARVVQLGLVLPARDERVELDRRLPKRRRARAPSRPAPARGARGAAHPHRPRRSRRSRSERARATEATRRGRVDGACGRWS